MHPYFIAFVTISSFFHVAVANAKSPTETTVKIPLNNIWAFRMPGTIDLEKVENMIAAKEIEAIRHVLSVPSAQGKEAESFVVLGTGLKAVHEAFAILVNSKKPRLSIQEGSEVSVVFFSHEFGRYVHLRSVECKGDEIVINYEFVPHKSKEVTEHFALIPIGKLSAGKVRVDIVQTPSSQDQVSAGWKPIAPEAARKIVCASFSFSVEQR